MKKLSILVLSSFLSAITLSYFAGIALAEDKPEQPTLQIYYSESLGTGERVMHITACKKAPAMGVVACTKEAVVLGAIGKAFGKQCDDEKKIGNTIKGCLKKPGADGDEYARIEGTSYPEVDIGKYELTKKDGGCSDDLENQSPLYGERFALIPSGPPEAGGWNESDIAGEIVIPKKLDVDITPLQDYGTQQMHEPTLCASWDKVISSDGTKLEEDTTLTEEQKKKLEELRIKIAAAAVDAEAAFATQDSCVGTEHGDKLDPAPMISCTVLERITGKSGTEILSKYMQMIYSWASGIIGIIAVLTMVYSGIQISMAGGDSAKIDEAKKRITQSIVGIVILFLSGLILYTINPTFFTGG